METALKIIAACEVIRILQNGIQLLIISLNNPDKHIKKATEAFVDNMDKTSDVECN